MAVGLNELIRNARANLIKAAIDADVNPGELKIYADTRPATGGALTGQVLLGTCTFSQPCAPDASGGVLTFSAVTDDDAADASGTATWARIVDGAGAFVMDIDVGLTGSGADFIMNTVTIVAGGPIRVASGTITEGGA
jgi:hypothetical protein